MTEDELRTLLGEHLVRTGVPGAVVGLLRGSDRIVAGTGIANTDTGDPVTDDMAFPIASITKTVAATVITRLSGSEAVDLDGPLSDQVPELSESPWATSATIRDLLANRGRVPLRVPWEFELDIDGPDALSQIAALLSEAEPAAPVWSYTNAGWCVLGRAVEVGTGSSWEAAIREVVLDTSGMRHTTFHPDHGPGPHPVGHQVVDGSVETMPDWTPAAYAATGSSIRSTAGDLLQFARVHLTDPGLASMRETHADTAIHGWFDAWCLGLARFDWIGTTAWGWDGNGGGFRAVLRLIPEHDAAVVLLSNGMAGRALYRSLFADLLPDWLEVAMPPLRLDEHTDSSLDAYAGTFAWPDWEIRVTAQDDHLRLETDAGATVARPAGHGVFATEPTDPDRPAVTFDRFDADGTPGVLYRSLWGFPRTQ